MALRCTHARAGLGRTPSLASIDLQCEMTGDTMKSNPVSRNKQYLTTASATLGALALGSVIGYTTHSLSQLTAEDKTTSGDELRLTSTEGSWFASSANLGAVVGGVIGGLAASRIGRRGTLLAAAPPFIAGWLMIAFANDFSLLLLGRLLTGVCMGAVCTVAPPYIGEFASPDIRGALGSCFQVMLTTGILYAFVLGALVRSWRLQAILCTIPLVLLLICMFFAMESPIFLLTKGKKDEAATALQHFRGKDYNIEEEMQVLKESVEDAQRNRISMKDLKKPYILKPLFISLFLMFFQQTTGVPAVMFNLITVFRESGSALSDDMSVILIGIVQVLATISGSVLVDRAGRKKLLIISTSFMALSIVGMGVYSFVSLLGRSWARVSMPPIDLPPAPVSPIGAIPLVFLIVFIVAFSIGLGPVPWLMMGELFPSNVRETAASLATAVNWSSAFVITLIFDSMTTALGDHGNYWVFGGICVLAILFSACFVPETKGKTLLEISAYFGGTAEVTEPAELRAGEGIAEKAV
ncbi:facilitated trehalose transporter Tret1-like [Penaeus japonicus]|uniref:facilitated trehalose transporter Tret1-like n=1 Tax=Penaeus japonicus TaxID=27405 RepID=UPI001C717159|nr:facilitated trehalose transporter Tret1-like [Penaeus japonicus]